MLNFRVAIAAQCIVEAGHGVKPGPGICRKWEFPKTRLPYSWSPYNKDPTI